MPLNVLVLKFIKCIMNLFKLNVSIPGDLKFARGKVNLLKIWKNGLIDDWRIAKKHAKHVCISILKGIQYLNCQGMQHYDIKGKSILRNSIMNIIIIHLWEPVIILGYKSHLYKQEP